MITYIIILAACSPGHYSFDGFGECNECPVNFIQLIAGSTSCEECASNFFTDGPGKTKQADCVDSSKFQE